MTKTVLALVLIHIFWLGIMLVDYGASFKCDNILFEGLVLKNVEPRVVYHFGLVLIIFSFLIMEIFAIYLLSKK